MPSGKEKRTVPELEVTPGLRALAEAYAEASNARAAAAARELELREQLISALKPLWREYCRRDKRYHTCMTADAGPTTKVRIVFPSFCKMMSYSDEHELRAIFGEKDFDRYFEVKRYLELEVEKLSRGDLEATLEVLQEHALEAVVVHIRVMPRDEYFEDRVLNGRTAVLAERAEKRGLAVPFSPSLTVRNKEMLTAHDS